MNIYTIGYATKPLDIFIQQLLSFNVNAIADIRSVPYSKTFHDYHKEAIAASLANRGIRYVYLGEELGPRSKDSTHYNNDGQVQFDRLMKSTLFINGIQRLIDGKQKGYNIALMCAEKDPAICHRSLLVGYFINHHFDNYFSTQQQAEILHIDHNGNIESQQELEQRLTEIHSLDNDLFMSDKERRILAYHQQLNLHAYSKPIV